MLPRVTLEQFHLVSANAAGVTHPLPAELGPLPLYLDDDGFYSVLGPPLYHGTPVNQVSGSTNDALAYSPINISTTLKPPGGKVFCGSSRCSGNRFAPPSAVLVHPYSHPQHQLT